MTQTPSAHNNDSNSGLVDNIIDREQIWDSTQHHIAIMSAAQDMLCIVDRNFHYRFISPAHQRFFGISSESLIGKDIRSVVGEEMYNESVKPQLDRAIQGEVVHYKYDWLHESGKQAYLDVHYTPYIIDEQIVGLLIMIRDVTEERCTQEQLALAATVFTHAREGVLIVRPDGTIVQSNSAFSEITGFSKEQLKDKNICYLQGDENHHASLNAIRLHTLEHGSWLGEFDTTTAFGTPYIAQLICKTVHGNSGEISHILVLMSDITEQKQHQIKLEQLAHFDPLTGLLNRTMLAEKLKQSITQIDEGAQKDVAVAYLDLDGFKEVNDRYGHSTGDYLLQILSQRMTAFMREGDILARLGGDEFVALLNGVSSREDVQHYLTALLSAASQPIQYQNKQLLVTASIGVTFYPQAEEIDADQLLRQADQAMYQAKLQGKNQIYLFDAAQERTKRSLNEEILQIRRALENREFVLFYQPKVNMHTGEVTGLEALIRWQHPEKGLLGPALFLPQIENLPFSIELGNWVIGAALGQMSVWKRMGINLNVSVNIGCRQLQQPDFALQLKEQLSLYPDIDPAMLTIEVLETNALDDVGHVRQVIQDCRAQRINFSLDDFGTGYSTLTFLKNLAVSELKIDRSFVSDILSDADDLAILDGILGLAKAFRCSVIAEGVETEEQGLLLLKLGCQHAQGFGIARPMPASLFAGWLNTWQPPQSWKQQKTMSASALNVIFALVEHRSWRTRAERYLRGEVLNTAISDHTQCRLGRWFYSEDAQFYKDTPAFIEAEKLHHQLHENYRYLQGVSEYSEEDFAQFTQLSDQLQQLLQELIAEDKRADH